MEWTMSFWQPPARLGGTVAGRATLSPPRTTRASACDTCRSSGAAYPWSRRRSRGSVPQCRQRPPAGHPAASPRRFPTPRRTGRVAGPCTSRARRRRRWEAPLHPTRSMRSRLLRSSSSRPPGCPCHPPWRPCGSTRAPQP
eukprot:7385838-Prymnesium_polylepis.1